MKRCICLVMALCLLLAASAALAEDCFTLDVDALDMNSLKNDDYVARALSSSAQGVCVRKVVSESPDVASAVRLTLMQMPEGTLLFDKDYGYQSGTFDSGVIYLPYVDDRTIPYLVTLYVGDQVYAMPFMHLQARLTGNGACSLGPRLSEMSAAFGGDWMMGTVVDLQAAAAQGGVTVPLCASNRYAIGQVHIAVQGGSVCVSPSYDPNARVNVHSQSVYVATDLQSLAAGQLPAAHALGEWVSVGDAACAVVYVSLVVDYDPSGLGGFAYGGVDGQLALWRQHLGAQPTVDPQVQNQGNGWIDNGGWADNDGWVDNGGWVEPEPPGDAEAQLPPAEGIDPGWTDVPVDGEQNSALQGGDADWKPNDGWVDEPAPEGY